MTEPNDELFDAYLDETLLVAPPPVIPPTELKNHVLEQITAEKQPVRLTTKRAISTKAASWLVAAASVCVLAIGGGIYYSSLQPQSQSDVSAKLQEDVPIGEAAPGQNAVPETAYADEMPAILEDSAAVLTAADAETTEIDIRGTPLTVVTSATLKESVVVLGQKPTGDRQLQLWALDSSGEPVFVGVLEKDLWIPLPYASSGLVVTNATTAWDEVSPEPSFPNGEILIKHQF